MTAPRYGGGEDLSSITGRAQTEASGRVQSEHSQTEPGLVRREVEEEQERRHQQRGDGLGQDTKRVKRTYMAKMAVF